MAEGLPIGQARTIAERVARRSYGKLVAFLAARTRDIAAAEDCLSDAFVAALAQWPSTGIPASPEGWLLTVARRRLTDGLRRQAAHEGASPHLQGLAEELAEAAEPSEIPDDRLRLMFACAHPALEYSVRSALILQTVLGLDAAAIASCFLVAPGTMSQRLVRAKAKIRQAKIGFHVPDRVEMPARLNGVLEAIYAAFTRGSHGLAEARVHREDLAAEALWLSRLVATMLPDEPEALGLLALLLHVEARRPARGDAAGEFVPLDSQDPGRWDFGQITEAEELLLAASYKGQIGRFQLEAAVQSAHAVRRFGREPDWHVLDGLYKALHELTDSPVVALNRALVVAKLRGPELALAELERLASDPRLLGYQPYWAAKADLLTRAGRCSEAGHAYDRAIELERDPTLRRFLMRQKQCRLTSGIDGTARRCQPS